MSATRSHAASHASRRPGPASAGRVRPPAGRSPAPWEDRRIAARLVLAVAAFGLLGTLLLWWRDTPTGSIDSAAAWLTGIGRLSGLVAGYTLAWQLVLMSRLDWLERRVGTERLVAWHRAAGSYVLIILSIHVVTITLGYGLTFHANPVAETLSLIRGYPDILAADAAFLLLVMVAVVSIRRVRARLAYETWYYLHFYTYLALALGFSHQFADGQEFATSAQARVLWSIVYVGAAGSLVVGRVVVPVRHALRHRLRVHSVVAEGDDVISIYLIGRQIAALRAAPGQFFRWRFLTRNGWWQAHPFSLSAAPGTDHLRITVKLVGDHTTELTRLRPGTRVLAEGPYGSFTADHCVSGKALLVAGGMGVAPIRALVDAFARQRRRGDAPLVVIYRARRERDLVFRTELDRIADAGHARVVYVLGRRGDRGPSRALSARGLADLVPDVAQRDVYVCGPPGLVQAVRSTVRRLGIPRGRLHLDPFEF